MASPPALAILPTTPWPPASSRSVTTTLAPSRASVVAQAAPIPEAPPVTIATFPSTCLISVLPSSCKYQLVIPGPSVPTLPLIPTEQQLVNALRLSQQFAQARQRAVDCLSIFPSPAKAFERLWRHEFNQQIGRPRRNAHEMHHQHAVIPEKKHRERSRGFVGHHRRLAHSSTLHCDLEDIVGGNLHRGGCLMQPIAEQWSELAGDLFRRRNKRPHPRRVVLFERPDHRRVEHLAGFHAEF